MLRLVNIKKSYKIGSNEVEVLKGIDLEIKKGEFVAIMGASGSGKSTLMNIIGCLDNMDSGNYYFEDIEISKCLESDMSKIRNKKIGFIFQKYHLIQQYSILQNVIMPLLIRGMSRKEAIKLANDSLELVGLSKRINHHPNELSGGEQQRAAIARALVSSPSLLLADEPTGALDSKTGKEILNLFKVLNEKGNTIIMITHDIEVAKNANRIIELKDGSVINKSN